MIPAVFVAVVACLALIYVTAPLRRRPETVTDDPERSARLERLLAQKRAALGAILDLEEEHAVGKLSRHDLDALRREYEAQALAVLREIDLLHAADDDELEAEIAALRERLENGLEDREH